MPTAYGTDRLQPGAGPIVLACRVAKGWTGRDGETPGTAVAWDDGIYEVLDVRPRPAGGVEYVLAPWDDRRAFSAPQAYSADSERARASTAVRSAPTSKESSRLSASWATAPPPVRYLAIGFAVGGLLAWFFPVRVMGEGMSALVHELGHTIVAIFFGHFAVPIIAVTFWTGQSMAFALLIWAGLVGLAWRARDTKPLLLTFGVAALLYPLFAFTSAHLTLMFLGGHAAEVGCAAWFLARAVRGGYFSDWERPVWAAFGFYLWQRNALLFGKLVFLESYRSFYLKFSVTGGDNDLTKIARDLGLSLPAIATLTLIPAVAVPAVVLVLAWRAESEETG